MTAEEALMTMIRIVLRSMTVGGCAAWLVGCSTAPVVKPAPPPEPAPVVAEAPKPPPAPAPKPLEFEKIYFTYDQAEITPAIGDLLKRSTDLLLERAEASVNIEGHCDERGTDEYNIDLGWKRAYAIRDYLKRMGIDEKRLYPISYGRSRPAVIGSDESAWSRNRRVELVERK